MFDKFIWQKRNALSPQFCNALIAKFEVDDNKEQGITGGGINTKYKISTDLNISVFDNYKYEDEVFFDSIKKGINEYCAYHTTLHPILQMQNNPNCHIEDTGYQIQRTRVGEYYKWHNDFGIFRNGVRLATYIWYLNDVDKGGETEFIDGTLIKPEQGKLVLFPAYWNYHHQGRPPISNTKYIVTGWLVVNPMEEMKKYGVGSIK